MIRMQAIVPGGFKPEVFQREFGAAMKRTIGVADREFKKTYKTWKHKPAFTKRVSIGSGQIMGVIETDDQIYIWVSEGTRGPYPIPKSGTKLLAFPSGYKAKTRPRVLQSSGGGSFGPTVFAQKVMHPGIEARKFDETVKLFVEPWFVQYYNVALKQATRASGHAI